MFGGSVWEPIVIAPIALTIGEPGGIGPEIAINAWISRKKNNLQPFFIISPISILRQTLKIFKINIPIVLIKKFSDIPAQFEKALPVFPLDSKNEKIIPGIASHKTVYIVIESIIRAVEMAKTGLISAIVTNPIHKSILYKNGFKYPGQTEFLSYLAGHYGPPIMMLVNSKLRVVPMTIHTPISSVPKKLTATLIYRLCSMTHAALKTDFQITKPRLAVAGLNPHAGEDGTIGNEEKNIIIPAVQKLQQQGFHVYGPLSADTMFHKDARAKYDVALCTYHDQALIPIKTLDFYHGVNITLGLPFIRASPDHGTALDIAGKGIARADSIITALQTVASIARNRFKD